MVRGVLLDIAGVLEQDGQAISGSVTAVARLKDAGYPLRYVTNTSRCTRQQLCTDLTRMGYQLDENEVFTAPAAMRVYCHTHKLNPHLVAEPQLVAEFESCRAYPGRAVAVCDAGAGFDFDTLNHAFQLLMDGAPLLAVGINRYYRKNGLLVLDAGPFVRALEFAAGCNAIVLGKPAPGFFHAAAAVLGCDASETLMVGDDVQADVIGAVDAGLQACLVQTGKYCDGDERSLSANQAYIAQDLADAVDQILAV